MQAECYIGLHFQHLQRVLIDSQVTKATLSYRKATL